MVTAAELDEVIESGEITWMHTYTYNGGGEYERSISDWSEAKYELPKEGVDTRIGRIAHVAEHGGMDQGSDYWLVVSVTNGDEVQYFKKSGWYASHVGGELDGDTFEVKPQEKVITVFQKA